MISALRVRGSPRPVSPLGETALPAMVFGPDQNQIEVEYVGLGFGTGERLRYQYRLDNGETEEWSEPGDERRISFARLTAGNYRLLVRALNDDGLVSAKPATVQFTVLAPVWQRWWVRALAVLLIAATLYMLYRYRLARVLEIERLRTRIATDLHDDLGSTLSQIAILSEVAGRQTGRQDQHSSLSEIADLARESVDSMSDIVWAIDPEKDRLGDLSHRMRRFAGDLFNGTGTQVHYRGPDEEPNPAVETEMRRHVFLIFKESLHNAARHAACTEVEIDFRLDESCLLLNIHDNGKGFDPGQVNRGHGLASIEHRADQLAAELHVKSSPGCGTSLSLRVPFRQSAHPRKTGLHKGIG